MKQKPLIRYETILAAKRGDAEAMSEILQRYEGYMISCSLRRFADKYGVQHSYIDHDIKDKITAKLMYQIVMDFDTERMPEGETQE